METSGDRPQTGEYIIPISPRQFFDLATESVTNDKSQKATDFMDDIGQAMAFYKGLVDYLEETGLGTAERQSLDEIHNDAQIQIIEATIKKPFEESRACIALSTQDLGVWPKIFDAINIERQMQVALNRTSSVIASL